MQLTRYQLDNGMDVLLVPNSAAPVVACNVWVGVGSADEEPHEAGLAHVHEHMLFKGTARRGVGEIAREVEAAGGHINAFTSFDQTCYYVVMSSRFFDTGLDILSDAIRRSSFEAEELGRELEVIQEEIKRGKDHPPRVASQMLFETAFAEHPYRLPVIGTKESVDSFEREHVVSFFEKHYVPDNVTLVLVGDFEIDQARELVEQYFGDWTTAGHAPVERGVEPQQQAFRGKIEAQEVQDANLRLAFHIPHATHDDIPALDMLSAVMGYGDASHLTQTIQRERELVNAVYATAYTPKDAGIFMVAADYQLEEERGHGDVIRALMEEVFRFRQIRVSEVDIRRARTLIESQEIYGKQTVEGLAMKLGRYKMVTGDPEFEQRYYQALAQVTPADLQRVARAYLTPENCAMVLLRPTESPEISTDELEEQTRRALEVIEADAIDGGLRADEEGFAYVQVPDGPTLLVQEDHSVETFAVRALTLGGVRFEEADNNGVGSLLTELITKGTHNRSAVEIAHETESMASGIHGMAGRNSFGLAMTGLSRFFEPCFEIFADCLLGSTIPEEEFERERKLQLQSIRSRQDRLGAVNYERFAKAFFGEHPYSMPVDGTEESISSLTVAQAREWLERLTRPSGLVLSLVGDVDAGEVAAMVERYIVRPEGPAPFRPSIPEPPTHDQPRLVVGDLEKEQAFVTVGFVAPPIDSEDRYGLELLYAILSGQGGRLFYELRDRQSLAYSVYASMVAGLEASAFTINIGTSPEKISQALTGMYEEVRKLHDHGVTEEEVARAKRFLIGNHDIGLQKNSSRAMSFALDELYGFGYLRSLEFSDRIEAVTSDDVERVVQTYLVPQTSVVSITKPESVSIPEDLLQQAMG